MKLIISITTLLIFHQLHGQSNDCSYAGTALTVGSTCTSSAFNSDNNTDYWNSAAGCSSGDRDDAWHWFTATATTTIITYNSSDDAILHVFTGACATNMTALTCVNATASGDETITLTTTIGVNYAIRIQRNNSDQNMTGTICVYSPPANDICGGATSVSCGNSYAGTTTGTSTTGETSLPSCGTSPSAAGVWYLLVGDGTSVTASLCSGTSYDTRINVYTGVSCASISSCVASDDDGCGSQSTVTFSTTIGTNYYILVNGFSSNTGNFNLSLTCCTPALSNCASSPSPANNATGVSACSSLSWIAPVNSGCTNVLSYDIYFGTSSTPPFYANTTVTTYSISTTPGTKYYWQIRPKNAQGTSAGCTIWNFTTVANPNSQYTMVDDATSAAPYSCVNLTASTNDQRGCAWDMNSTLNFTSNFSYDFTVNLGSSDAGADGLAFVMQNDPLGRCKCGTTGDAIGAGGITKSVIVEIDTYINTNDRDDFSTSFIGCGGSEDPDHLDIWFNGAVNPSTDGDCGTMSAAERTATPTAIRLKDAGSNYNIENGLDHILRISWDAGSQTLTATVLNTAFSKSYGVITSSFNPLIVFGTNSPYFGFTASTGGLNNTQSFCNPSSLLPVELVSFHSYCADQQMNVYWSTASETNHDYFILERSLDGQLFKTLNTFQSTGDKSDMTYYEFEDYDRFPHSVYYRLTQVDLNGVKKIYDPISASCIESNSSTLNISLVQATENEQVSIYYFTPQEGENYLTFYNMEGKMMRQTKQLALKGNNEISLNNLNLSEGIYLIQLRNAGEMTSTKYFYQTHN